MAAITIPENKKSLQPLYYHRQYENDVKGWDPKNHILQRAQRIGLIALPFLSLYKPFGTAISLTMNATRTFSCLARIAQTFSKGDRKEMGIALLQTTLAVASIAGTIFANSYGMVITSGHDILINLYETLDHLSKKEYEQALEQFLQMINNSLYLAMILHGSLEIVVLSFTAQVIIEAFKSQELFRKFKNSKDVLDLLEGFAHITMAGIRGHQTHSQFKMLKFKWTLKYLAQKRLVKKENEKNILNTNLSETSSKKSAELLSSNSGSKQTPQGISSVSASSPKEELKYLSVEKIYEEALLAIKKGDLDGFLSLEKECKNWNKLNKDYLGHLTYELFADCLNFNDAEKNKFGLKVLEILVIKHPNAVISTSRLSRLLQCISLSGNIGAFKMLMEKHPLWNELTASNLLDVFEDLFQGAEFPGGAIDEEKFKLRMALGKEEIVPLLMRHDHFNKESPAFIFKFVCIIEGGAFCERIKIFEEIKNYAGWKNLDEKKIAIILREAQGGSNIEYIFNLVSTHPAWEKIDKDLFVQITCKAASLSTDTKIKLLDILMTHPNWKKIDAQDLTDIISSLSFDSEYNYDFAYQITRHPEWVNLSEEQLYSIALDGREDEILKLLYVHPKWNSIDKDHMADLASMAANRDHIAFLQVIAQHPRWKDFNENDLIEIIKWSYWKDNLDEIIAILATHEKWKDVEERVRKFLEKKRSDDFAKFVF